MQPVIACVPGWNRLLLLLRRTPMLATICTLLRNSLFRPDAAPDSNAVTKHDTHLSSTPSVSVPAGVRKGVRVRWRMYDMQLCAPGNTYCDVDKGHTHPDHR
jgi:hypothetical protein